MVPGTVCSRGCSAAPLTWGMWFHVCTGASGNGCSIAHSVRDLPGEASGLDSQRFEDLNLWTKLIRRGEGGVGLKLAFCCPNQSLVKEYSLPTPGWNWGGGPLHLGEGLNASALGIPSVCAQAIWWVIFNKTLILKRGRGSLKLFPMGRTKRVFFRLNVIKHR